MLLSFNDGSTYEMPTIHQGGYDSGMSNFPTWGDSYWQYYEKNSPTLQLTYLQSFADSLASMPAYDSVDAIYYDTQTLRQDDHELDYYTEGIGRNIIDKITSKMVWIIGSAEEGGLGLMKVHSVQDNVDKYCFICFSGVYQSDNNHDLYYYGYTATAYTFEGSERGTYTYEEITKGGLCLNTDVELSSPPIWFCYDYRGMQYRYYIDYYHSVAYVDDRWEDGDFLAATNTARYTWYDSIPFTWECPVRPWCAVSSFGKMENVGLDNIAGEAWRPEHTKISGDIYGNAQVDMEDDPYGNGGFNGEDGGSGEFSGDNDDGGWTDPDQFAIDALNSGFLTVYNPTKAEVKSFNDFLFTDITDSIAQQLKHLITSPLDYVVYLAMVHFTPNRKGSKKEIKFCGIGSGVSSNVVAHQMQTIDCGSIYVDEKAQTGSYLSYSPYTKVRCYLPYIGMVELSSDDVMGSTVTIKYVCDLVSGSCIAQVGASRGKRRRGDVAINNVIAEFTGNVFQDLPLSSTDWRGLYQSVVAFSGGLVAAASGSVAGLGAIAGSVMSQKQSVARSGQLGSNYGYLGYQKPYLLIERPLVLIPEGLGKHQGWTTFFIDKLKNFSGYTEIQEGTLKANNIVGITKEEVDMLEEQLVKGVYLNWEGED